MLEYLTEAEAFYLSLIPTEGVALFDFLKSVNDKRSAFPTYTEFITLISKGMAAEIITVKKKKSILSKKSIDKYYLITKISDQIEHLTENIDNEYEEDEVITGYLKQITIPPISQRYELDEEFYDIELDRLQKIFDGHYDRNKNRI